MQGALCHCRDAGDLTKSRPQLLPGVRLSFRRAVRQELDCDPESNRQLLRAVL